MEDQKREIEGIKKTYKDVIDEYFQKYNKFFPDSVSKAIFLEGALVGFLLETQRLGNPEKKGNEPFWNSLHNLRLDKRRLLDLFPKTVTKLKQLGKSYSSLVHEISFYLQRAGMEWNLSQIEMSWYFTHGMASYQYFKLPDKKTIIEKSL